MFQVKYFYGTYYLCCHLLPTLLALYFLRASARVVEHVLEDSLFAHNAESVYVKDTAIGFTDQLASFVKLGYVAGPFKRPPLENFRVNQILGVQQTGKIRPVMNLSHPEHESFNDAIPEEAFPKV